MKKGFTLIELLVVISIIAILSALLMANFIGVRQRSRDATRKSDLQNIRQALELYRADIGSYPPSSPTNAITCNGSLADPQDANVVYMADVPCDPTSGSSSTTGYSYVLGGNGSYTLSACIENAADSENTISSCSASSDPCCSGSFHGKVTFVNP